MLLSKPHVPIKLEKKIRCRFATVYPLNHSHVPTIINTHALPTGNTMRIPRWKDADWANACLSWSATDPRLAMIRT